MATNSDDKYKYHFLSRNLICIISHISKCINASNLFNLLICDKTLYSQIHIIYEFIEIPLQNALTLELKKRNYIRKLLVDNLQDSNLSRYFPKL